MNVGIKVSICGNVWASLDEGITRFRSGGDPGLPTRRTAVHAASPGRACPENVLSLPPFNPLLSPLPHPAPFGVGGGRGSRAVHRGSERAGPSGQQLREPVSAAAAAAADPSARHLRCGAGACARRRRPHAAAILGVRKPRWRPRVASVARVTCACAPATPKMAGARIGRRRRRRRREAPERRPTWASTLRAPVDGAGAASTVHTDRRRMR